MTDYLLRFDSKLDFDALAEAQGLAVVDPATGEVSPTLATFTYAQVIIGEHFVPTGGTVTGPDGLPVPELAGDGFHWVLFRELEPVPAITALAPYAQWASSFVDGAGDPVPRPADPSFPQTTWL